MIGAGCLQIEFGQAEFFETLDLASLEILRIFEPDMPTFGEFRAVPLLDAADLVHSLVDNFHDVKFVEGDLSFGECSRIPPMNA